MKTRLSFGIAAVMLATLAAMAGCPQAGSPLEAPLNAAVDFVDHPGHPLDMVHQSELLLPSN